MYPRGASQVQCSVCGTITCAMQANAVGHVVCGSCNVTLMYSYGAQSVKCAVCNHVTHVTHPYPPSGAGGAMPQQQPQQQGGSSQQPAGAGERPRAEVQHVVIENPPTLDDKGQEVQSIAVGVTTKQDAPK